jgi:hypothetical protein
MHFPSERILAIHLEERHDPFAESQRAKHTYKVSQLRFGGLMVVQVLCGGMSGDVWWGFETQYAYDLFALFSGGTRTV